MQGRRLPDASWPDGILPADLTDLHDGDYWKCTGYHGTPRPAGQPADECWCVYYGGAAMIPHHEIEEHDDGTITIEPRPGNSNSILISDSRGERWHGYIYRGEWKEC